MGSRRDAAGWVGCVMAGSGTGTRGVGTAWTCQVAREGEVARLSSVGARVDVRELYDAAAEPRA